ncbi:reverse transcriptase domain-containing protein [Tanacetum coccineum]
MAPKRATRSTPVTTTPAPTATTTTTVTNAQLQAMIDQGVSAALAARDATRNGIDSHTSGTGVRGSERVARECTYQDFMKCKPLYFKGTEGVVELTQWFERMETVFRISNCSVENQIKFSTCTLLASALTWWNSHVMTVTHDVAYSMTWVELRKKMTDKYCPRNEMKKLEAELWNLKVIGTDVVKYNQCFQELALPVGLGCSLRSQEQIERMSVDYRHDPWTTVIWKKGFPIFLAHVTTKEVEDKSEKKRLKDVPIVQDFHERSISEDLPVFLRLVVISDCAPILALPEGGEDFIAYCDASKKGLGAVLMPREKVISYAFHLVEDSMRKNYTTPRFRTWCSGVRSQDLEILFIWN